MIQNNDGLIKRELVKSRRNRLVITCHLYLVLVLITPQGCSPGTRDTVILSCREDNDLYHALKDNRISCSRYDTPGEAISNAREGSGVMILADDYPVKTSFIDSSFFQKAYAKKLRLFVEYPSFLPGIATGLPRRTTLERVVVTTDSIEGLANMQILCIHGCHYIPAEAKDPILSVAKVAGFDRAVYGLDNIETNAILFMIPSDRLLVSTTKLSQFITARYAPEEPIRAIWAYILKFIIGKESDRLKLKWTRDVRPSFSPGDELPAGASRQAVIKGIDWHTNAKMLLSENGWEEYKKLWGLNDTNMLTTVASVNNAAPPPVAEPGDGSFGVLEGIASEVHLDGSQPVRWWLRSDSNGESSLAFALRGALDSDSRSTVIAKNLLDWLYFTSGLFQNDPCKSNYGLLFWAPGNDQALYQDNDIKAILGCMGTSAILNTDRWDEVLVKNILGNFRTTGVNGFRGRRIENPDLLRKGWTSYRDRNTVLLQPHYEAWTWASYLWLYDKTHWKPLLEKTRYAISMMMDAYADGWRWTNGIQQERGRMLLPLAWLIRIDDRPEYREWLKKIATDIEKCQDKSGAIQEELGAPDHGDYVPSRSNAEYGTNEAPLIQQNGDPVSDLLYTCNFTFLGLHEAYSATGDEQLKRMEDKLADFLVRIQVRSEKHPEIDGGWFRAFDFRNWEYMGSNADSGWGAWSIETGWTQAWIPSVLAMRELDMNLWDITSKSKAEKIFDKIRNQMMPDSVMSE
jgi:hypothetical protein